jgi:predicted nucleic acid-binding protein
MTRVFLDANIPVYAFGAPHVLKDPCLEVMHLLPDYPALFVTDVEVLQELLHRYLAIRRWPEGRRILAEFITLMKGRTEPVYLADIEQATSLADRHAGIDSRDLVHAAVMRRLGVTRIVSADRDFDRLPGIERLDPADVSAWRATLAS